MALGLVAGLLCKRVPDKEAPRLDPGPQVTQPVSDQAPPLQLRAVAQLVTDQGQVAPVGEPSCVLTRYLRLMRITARATGR